MITERLAKADPGPEDDHRALAEFLTEERTGDVRCVFVLLMGSVCLVLILGEPVDASVHGAAKSLEWKVVNTDETTPERTSGLARRGAFKLKRN